MKKWLSDNAATILVALFIVGITFGFARQAAAEVNVEFGPTAIGGDPSEGYMLLFNERLGRDYLVGMGLMSKQQYKGRDTGSTLLVHVQRLVPITDKFSLGLGVAYLNNEGVANGSPFNASLSVEYCITHRIKARWRHFSNGGSNRPNPGHDILTFSWLFR